MVQVSEGGIISMALCADSTIDVWGDNAAGELATGSFGGMGPVPQQVNVSATPLEGRKVIQVAAGNEFCLALCSDGTIVSWGRNEEGELGIGGTFDSATPVQVSMGGAFSSKTAVAISAGGEHCLALFSDGSVAAWGNNDSGQLGNGGTTSSPVPVQVNFTGVFLSKPVVAISAAAQHSVAYFADGTVATWGDNLLDELGTGDSNGSTQPVPVDTSGLSAGKRISAVTSGDVAFHNLALVGGTAQEILADEPVLSGDTVQFGTVAVGGTGFATLTLNNNGLTTLTGLNFSITGSAGSEFQFSTPGTTAIASGSSVNIPMTFTPLSSGLKSAVLQVFSSAPGSPYLINLLGTGAGSTFPVSPGAGANGSISPNAQINVASGGSQQFTATPAAGFTVDQWYLDGSPAQTGGANYTLSNVLAAHTVFVTFQSTGIQTYTVTPAAGANGSINPATPQVVNPGGNVNFTATPASQYVVDQWLVNGSPAQLGGSTFTLSNILASAAVTVTFATEPENAFFFNPSEAMAYMTDGLVTGTVTRNFSAAATVDYETIDGSALAGLEYASTQGTLTFAQDEMQKTISVPVLPFPGAPGDSYFTLLLMNPEAGSNLVDSIEHRYPSRESAGRGSEPVRYHGDPAGRSDGFQRIHHGQSHRSIGFRRVAAFW